MALITPFPSRAENIADRLMNFMAHLRSNGFQLGASETALCLEALLRIRVLDMGECRLALRSICAGNSDEFQRFDDLFRAFWQNKGCERTAPTQHPTSFENRRSNQSLFELAQDGTSTGDQDTPDEDGTSEADANGEGKLVATRRSNIHKTDLREFFKPEDLEKASRIAEDLARAMRDRRSRRRIKARKGAQLDLRRMVRRSLARGGEPIDLLKKRRPDRPVHVVCLLDVSGSMVHYARVFLSFLKGLVHADQKTDAYLFHTQLVRICDPLRDQDSFRAINRMTMMAQGFGGGTKIGSNLDQFNRQYAAKQVGNRSVVMILSDGYDTDPPEKIAQALHRLKKRGAKIIWLNPLKGWKDYAPVAQGMAAALPYLDHFAAASTLGDLARLEPHLARI